MRFKYILHIFVLFALITFVGCAGAPPGGSSSTSSSSTGGSVLPWGSSGMKIGYIRSDEITDKHADYRDADNQLREDNREWLDKADLMDAEIVKKEKEMEELSLILGQERKQTLDEEIVDLRKELQKFKHETWYDENSQYIKRRRELMEPIDARVNDAIWKVGEREGYDYVFDAVGGNIVYVNPEHDLTEKVMEELED